jgi:hypothetical protein
MELWYAIKLYVIDSLAEIVTGMVGRTFCNDPSARNAYSRGSFSHVFELDSTYLTTTQRLHAFETHLNTSEFQARELLETQAMHAKAIETQAQAQEALGASAKVVFAILEKLTTRAAYLESILEETANRFNDLQHIDGFFGMKISAWTAFSLLFSVIAVQNPKVAVITFAFAGGLYATVLERYISNISQF